MATLGLLQFRLCITLFSGVAEAESVRAIPPAPQPPYQSALTPLLKTCVSEMSTSGRTREVLVENLVKGLPCMQAGSLVFSH